MKYVEYILLALGALGIIYAILTRAGWSPRQRVVKMVLHLLVGVVLYLLIRNPSWPTGDGQLVVYDRTVPRATVEKVMQERKLVKSKPANRYFSEPEAGDEVLLLGQGFSAEQLSHLAGKAVDWQAYFADDKPQEMRWNANMRRGLLQTVGGRIRLSTARTLRLKYAGVTLDSLVLEQGYRSFALQYPVHTEGRTALELWIDDKKERDILFYARPMEAQRISIVEEFPSIEHRILAEWLGRRGHEVKVSTPIAKGHVQQTLINKSSGYDLIISPTGSVKPGVPTLVIDGENISQLNRTAGTNFQLNPGADHQAFAGEVQHYKHKAALRENQFQVGKLPVYVEQKEVKIGVSLLVETFPAKLSGDSVLYDRIWAEILGAMGSPDSLLLEGPVYAFQEVESSVKGNFYAADTGWVKSAPYGEIYVENDAAATLSTWVKSNAARLNKGEDKRKYLADIWKFMAVLCSLGLVWLEPKFKY